MAWTQKNGGLPAATAAAAGRSGCRSTRSEISRRAPAGAPPEPASPRMRFARSFRLAAERESRLRAGSEGSLGAIGAGAAKAGAGAPSSRVPSARRRAGAPANSPQIPIGAGPPSTCTASPHSNVT